MTKKPFWGMRGSTDMRTWRCSDPRCDYTIEARINPVECVACECELELAPGNTPQARANDSSRN
jgi:hypothetical protein